MGENDAELGSSHIATKSASLKGALLAAVGVALDGVEVGYCAFDRSDRVLAWNATFLDLFPEHDGKIHAGEPYAHNLRRFYQGRLTNDELPLIDRYISEGIGRHRGQRRPYEFDHRHFRVRVSSVEVGRLGRIRVWRKVANLETVPTHHLSNTTALAAFNSTTVLERLVDGVLIVDVADRIMWANQAFMNLYGIRAIDQAVGQRFEAIYRAAWAGQDRHPEFLQSMETLLENQRFSGAPFELALPGDHHVRVFEQRGEADGRGYFEHLDITHLKRQQTALARAEQRYRLLAEFSSDIILTVEGGSITYASPALTSLLGWHADEVLGKSIVAFCHSDDVGAISQALRSVDGGTGQVDYQARALHRDGSFVWLEARARHLPGQTTSLLTRRIINLRGIDARKIVEDELENAKQRLLAMATTDPLTGLANRRKLDDVLSLEFRRSLRDGLPLSVILLDIDHFKKLNDSYGHLVGDDVLRLVATVLQSYMKRAGDLAVRIGGEEFVIVLPGTDRPQAAWVADEIVHAVARTAFAPPVGTVTISAGVATLGVASTALSPEELLAQADRALYSAKRAGRNRSQVAL